MNTQAQAHRHPAAHRGFTLIEVLVTIIVLAIGLLGLAGLQMAGLKYNHSAYMRSQATVLANDMIDRIRSNRDAALNGSYDATIGQTFPAAACAGLGANCTAAEMAAADLYEWKQALQDTFPSGDGSITRTVAGSVTEATIVIQWDDSRGETAATQFIVETLI